MHRLRPRGSIAEAAAAPSASEHIGAFQDLHTYHATQYQLPCSARKRVRGEEHQELKKMRCEDRRSDLVGLLIVARAAPTTIVPTEEPRFSVGQSIIQWWASWMKEIPEGDLPEKIQGKRRPTWFSGEVVQYAGVMSILYTSPLASISPRQVRQSTFNARPTFKDIFFEGDLLLRRSFGFNFYGIYFFGSPLSTRSTFKKDWKPWAPYLL